MNLKKGLLGLFVLCFLLSGVGLALLVLDDQNDLSSRAATGILNNARPALRDVKELPSNLVWTGELSKIPYQLSFNKSLWLPPQDQEPVFLHLASPITARLYQGKVSPSDLEKILGVNFLLSSILNAPQTYLDGWQTQSYSFLFFNEEKIVDVWTNAAGLSLIAVMPDQISRGEVRDLVKGILPASQVKGISTPDDSARLAAIVRPSVVMILNQFCSDLKFTEASGSLLVGKNYPFCLAQAGSGFFVSDKGFIATNGHVVTNLPDTSLTYGVLSGSLDPLLTDFFQIYLSSQTGTAIDRAAVEQKVKDAHQNKEAMYQFAGLVSQLLKKKYLQFENSMSKFYVQLGNTPIQLSKTGVNVGNDIVSATYVDADYGSYDAATGFTASDVALIKVAGEGYPALPLGNLNEVSVGSEILVVGYPGVAMGTQSLLLDTSANAEPTFTRGVISAFKQAKGDKKNLIQTDASINHGNSGGPAVSSQGNVIGIATYGLAAEEGTGNYNFLRDIADLRALMIKNKVAEEPGKTYASWKSGLTNYYLSYLRPAEADFRTVNTLYGKHPTVAKYLSETTPKVGTADDKTPRFTRTERKILMNISGGLMAISILAILVIGISNFVDNKRRRAGTTLPPRPNLPSQTVQTF